MMEFSRLKLTSLFPSREPDVQKEPTSGFKFGKRSRREMKGVHPTLIAVTTRALEISDVDFGVTAGLRTLEEQKRLVALGRSQTMKSKHLPQEDGWSHAIDLLAYDNGKVTWEISMYAAIADAMKQACIEQNVSARWGAAWHQQTIGMWKGPMEELMNQYVDIRRSQGRTPFIDGPHFELT